MPIKLDLRYRPTTFAALIGQPIVARYLSNAIRAGRHPHVILEGEYGLGKTSAARIYARALNCLAATPAGDPCNACEACRVESFPDFIETDATTAGGKERIAELGEIARTPPLFGRQRVMLIEEAQGLSRPAWDTLQKLLEEPPPTLTFIFTTTEFTRVNPAVASKCAHLEVRRLSFEMAVGHLGWVCDREGIAVEPGALDLLAHLAHGHVRDLLNKLSDVTLLGPVTVANVRAMGNLNTIEPLLDFWAGLVAADMPAAMAALDASNATPAATLESWREFICFLRFRFVHNLPLGINPVFALLPEAGLSGLVAGLTDLAHAAHVTLADAMTVLSHALTGVPNPSRVSLRLLAQDLFNLLHHHALDGERMGLPSPAAARDAMPHARSTRGRQFNSDDLDTPPSPSTAMPFVPTAAPSPLPYTPAPAVPPAAFAPAPPAAFPSDSFSGQFDLGDDDDANEGKIAAAKLGGTVTFGFQEPAPAAQGGKPIYPHDLPKAGFHPAGSAAAVQFADAGVTP